MMNELTLADGFEELTIDESMTVNGGGCILIAAAVIGIIAIGAVLLTGLLAMSSGLFMPNLCGPASKTNCGCGNGGNGGGGSNLDGCGKNIVCEPGNCTEHCFCDM